MHPTPSTFSRRAAALALVSAMSALPAHTFAQTNGSWAAAASGNWSDTASWTGGTVASGDGAAATFTQNWAGQTATVDANFAIGSILASDTTANGSLIIAGPGILTLANGSNKPVIQTDVGFTEPGGSSPFNNPLRITAVLAGSNGFEKTGAGYLSLEAANTFTGNVKLTAPASGGSFLRLTNDNNLGDANNDIDVVANVGAVGIYASTGFTVTLNSGRNISTSSTTGTQDFWVKTKGTGNLIIEGVISGGTRLRKNDSGTVTLSGANTFTGNTFIEGGTLVLTGGDNRLPSGSSVTMGNSTTATTLTINGGNQTLSNLVLTAPASAVTQTIGGTGGLAIQGIGNYTIGATVTATSLNMSTLNNFTFTRAANDFSVTATNASVVNTVNLAKTGTNSISANNVYFGGGGNATASGQLSNIGLGQNNEFNIGTEFVIGNFQGSGNVTFQSGLTAPVLKVRGAAGGSTPVAGFRIGRTNSGNQASTGTLNLTGGSLDVIASQFDVAAHNASAATAATGTLTMPAGTVEATTLSIARKTNTTGTPTITGTMTQGGGTVTADSVFLGNNEGASAANLVATYNLNGGTLATAVLGGNGATFGASSNRTLNFGGGTLRNKAGGDLAVSGLNTTASGRLNLVVGAGNGTIEADAGRTVSLADTVRLSGAGTLTKAGAGTLLINADSTAFTGGLAHSAGVIEIGAADAVSTFNAASFTWNGGATVNFDLGASGTSDLLALTGAFAKGTGSGFVFDFGGTGVDGGSYTLTSFASTTFNQSDFSFANLASGLTGSFTLNANNLVLNVTSAIPEPSAFAALAGLGALGLAASRRRRPQA